MHMCTHCFLQASLERVRTVYEAAISAAGLNVAEGGKLWNAYRGFEQLYLEATQDSGDKASQYAPPACVDAKTCCSKKQVERLRGLFRRQLSLPLLGMEEVYAEYKAWEQEQRGNSTQLDSVYKQALAELDSRRELEAGVPAHESGILGLPVRI
jgi:hypothetical protein